MRGRVTALVIWLVVRRKAARHSPPSSECPRCMSRVLSPDLLSRRPASLPAASLERHPYTSMLLSLDMRRARMQHSTKPGLPIVPAEPDLEVGKAHVSALPCARDAVRGMRRLDGSSWVLWSFLLQRLNADPMCKTIT